MKLRPTVFWSIGALASLAIATYAELVREMSNYDPFFLVACVDHDVRWRSWTCRQVLRCCSLKPEQVARLNRQAAVGFAARIEDPAMANEMISLFVERGVDINAPDWWFGSSGQTALQSLAISGETERILMLLKHGAQPDVRDAAGRTALDLARQQQAAHPSDSNRAAVVRLLERVAPPAPGMQLNRQGAR